MPMPVWGVDGAAVMLALRIEYNSSRNAGGEADDHHQHPSGNRHYPSGAGVRHLHPGGRFTELSRLPLDDQPHQTPDPFTPTI